MIDGLRILLVRKDAVAADSHKHDDVWSKRSRINSSLEPVALFRVAETRPAVEVEVVNRHAR